MTVSETWGTTTRVNLTGSDTTGGTPTRESVVAMSRLWMSHQGVGAVNLVAPVLVSSLDDAEDELMRAYVSRLWSRDWESAEDSVYDA